MRKCKKCNNNLFKADGNISIMGSKGKYITVDVYYCKVCGEREIE